LDVIPISLQEPFNDKYQKHKSSRKTIRVWRRSKEITPSAALGLFKTSKDRQAFVNEVNSLGYKFAYNSKLKGRRYPFGICIHKIHRVNQDSMDSIFAELTEIAESCGGEYDGWETEVIRSVH
jgi:regulator of ribonuclease activity B